MSIADYGFAIWETFYVTVLSTAFSLGLPGIQMAQMVADLLTFLCSVPIQIWVLKKLSQPQK